MKKSNLKANLFYNMLYQFMILILPLITAPYISRVVGAEGVGIYSYANSVALYFVYFAMLGVTNYGNRSIARVEDDIDKRNEVFSSIYELQIITSAIIFLVYIFYVYFVVKENKVISALLVFQVISAIFDVSWVFFGLQEFKITSIRQIVIRVVTFFSIFIFVHDKNDLWKYTLIMGLGYFISAFSLWLLLWKRISWKKVKIKYVFSHLRPSLVLFVPIIATSVYRVLDKIMIGSLCDMTQVGYYESAEKMIFISLGLISSFSAVVMPKISNLLGNCKYNEAKRMFDMSMEFAMCLGIAIAFGIAAISKEFIPIFFGSDFAPSIKLSVLLSINVPFITWANIVRVLYLIPYEKDKIYLKSIVIGAILNIVFNAFFIPKIGTIGAILGTWIAEISVAIYQTVKSKDYIEVNTYLKKCFYFCCSGIIMTIVVRLIRLIMNEGIACLFVEIILGGIVYMTLVSWYFIVSHNESVINTIKNIKYIVLLKVRIKNGKDVR